jgi:hypothetical protein
MTRIPGDFSARLVRGTLQEFLDNAESDGDCKVLRIVRMPSETPTHQTTFGTEYVAWRESKSRVYCKQEDPSLINSLRWNDISITHSIQWWTHIPHGFGAFIDIRTGSQLVVIPTPDKSNGLFDRLQFSNPGFYLPRFERATPHHRFATQPEAILLTAGMRLWVLKSHCYRFANRRS